MKHIKLLFISIIGLIFLASCGDNGLADNSDNSDSNCFVFDKEKQRIVHYNFYKEECGQNVVIPEKINGVEVLSIWERAFMNPHFPKYRRNFYIKMTEKGCEKEKDCPKIIKEEMQKFYKYYKTIESVKLPQSLSEINEGAFIWNALNDIQLPDTIEDISYAVFDFTQLSEEDLEKIEIKRKELIEAREDDIWR